VRRLEAYGLVSKQQQEKPLEGMLDDFKMYLVAKGNTSDHIRKTVQSCRRIIEWAGLTELGELTERKVERYFASRRGEDRLRKYGGTSSFSVDTRNHYVAAIKHFARWAGRPLNLLKKINADPDRRRIRRAASPEQFARLLKAAWDGPKWASKYGNECRPLGTDRYWLYRFAAETGLRANEIRSLTRASFVLDAPLPHVRLHASDDKARQSRVVAIRTDTANDLLEWFGPACPDSKVFRVPKATAAMLRYDLERAGIPFENERGETFDFHALRHTFATNAAAVITNIKELQEVLRLATPALVMRYAHASDDRIAKAMMRMPKYS